MYTVCVTGRKVKGLGATVAALSTARGLCRRAKTAPGNAASTVFHKKGVVFVLTVWNSVEAALESAPQMPEAQVVTYPSLKLPNRAQAYESWIEELNAG